MYGSDAGQPVPSLYTKGLSPLCDIGIFFDMLVCTKFHHAFAPVSYLPIYAPS